jgi:hypothetical protein
MNEENFCVSVSSAQNYTISDILKTVIAFYSVTILEYTILSPSTLSPTSA